MTTAERIVEAAASLLDKGGESAVTLRAVGLASGISHNAPYKHFKDRSTLLAAVATRDFIALERAFATIGSERARPLTRLKRALQHFVRYGQEFPARYRLLYSDPAIATQGGNLEAAALKSFAAFASLVSSCQQEGQLPSVPTLRLAGLIYASVHGLIDLQAGGRMRSEKGFKGVEDGVALLLTVLSQAEQKRSTTNLKCKSLGL